MPTRFSLRTLPLGLLFSVFSCTFSPPPADGVDEGPDPVSDSGAVVISDTGAEPAADADADPTDAGEVPDAGFDASAPDATGPIDGGFFVPDSAPVFADAGAVCAEAWAYAPTNFDPCAADRPAIGPAVNLPPGRWFFDTTTEEIEAESGATIDIEIETFDVDGESLDLSSVAGLTLAEGASLTVIGPRPWVLFVHGAAEIDGIITAHTGTPTGCDDAELVSGESAPPNNGGGGGGGGGHAFRGGVGGTGRGQFGGRGASGTAIVGPMGIPLRPGCPGGTGGPVIETDDDTSTLVAEGGAGGRGGGALQISVRDQLRINGRLLAVGEGGTGGAPNLDEDSRGGAGGGGGGAGGDLLLESYDLLVIGEVCAGGGSGGSGGRQPNPGADGADGACSVVTTPMGVGGAGGPGNANGPGGDGRDTNVGIGSGGGGGGGSAGRIQLRYQRSGFVRPLGVRPTPSVRVGP